MLIFLEAIDPQLKPLSKISTVYDKGIHAYENLEQSFSQYNQKMRAIR